MKSEDALGDRVAELVSVQMRRFDLGGHARVADHHFASHRRSSNQEASCWLCRRSLRLWPISGPDLLESVSAFLIDKLGLDRDAVCDSLVPETVRRIVEPRSKIQNEALVVFGSPHIRDSVKAAGFKLEGQRAGIRIEVPNYLKSDFQVLQSVSYRMKLAHPGIKRSIKFDDENLGLILDVQIPGKDWTRIRPNQARAAKRSDPLLRSGPAKLSSEMITEAIRLDSTTANPSVSLGSDLTGSNMTPLGQRP